MTVKAGGACTMPITAWMCVLSRSPTSIAVYSILFPLTSVWPYGAMGRSVTQQETMPGRADFLPISSELHRIRAPPVRRAHLPPCASGALASLMVCALATPSSSASFFGGGAESTAADRRRCGRVLLAGRQPKSGLVAISSAVIPLSTRPPTACCSTTRHAISRSQRLRADSPADEPTRNPGYLLLSNPESKMFATGVLFPRKALIACQYMPPTPAPPIVCVGTLVRSRQRGPAP